MSSRAVVLVAALAAAGLTARLGLWQLGRADEKRALQASRDERARLPALTAADLARDAAAVAAQLDRRVELSGAWVADASVYLENRSMDGRVGFFVVTPLVLDDGRTVVVQRGWLPREAGDRTRLAPHATPPGRVALRGRIAPTVSRMYQLGDASPGPIRQNLDLADYARELRRALAPLVVVQDDDTPGVAADGLLRHWPQPASDVHKNLGYAFQWFGLSALVVILYVWFQVIRPRRLARR
ncbi:MAG: SURF1 family protein [Rubrivivax sp.]